MLIVAHFDLKTVPDLMRVRHLVNGSNFSDLMYSVVAR